MRYLLNQTFWTKASPSGLLFALEALFTSKNEPRSWGLAGTFPEDMGKEEMAKNGNTIHIPLTIPWCTKPLNFHSLVQRKR